MANATLATKITYDVVDYYLNDGSTITLASLDVGSNRNKYGQPAYGHGPVDNSPGDLQWNPPVATLPNGDEKFLSYSANEIGEYKTSQYVGFAIFDSRSDGVFALDFYLLYERLLKLVWLLIQI